MENDSSDGAGTAPQSKRLKTEEKEQIPEEDSPPSSPDEVMQQPASTQSEYTPQFHSLFHVSERPQKRKYTHTFKMFSLELFFKHPKAYRLLQSTYDLPRISTLYRLCIPATAPTNENVLLTALKMKVSLMSPDQRVCAVCVGSVPVAANVQYDAKNDKMVGVHEFDGAQTLEPARTALIITVRGLFHHWKQAVAFSFLSNSYDTFEVKTFIDKTISTLFNLGLKIVAYVTDLETDKMTGDRKLSVTDPTIVVDQRKIYFFYDPLHLMKTVRDNMLTNLIEFPTPGLYGRWSDIEQCYKKNKFIPLAPKLTQNHIKPPSGAIDDLKLTADVFSRETARAISAYIDMNAIKIFAKSTAQWISIMSKCLDTLNFSSTNSSRDKNLLFTGKTAQVEFLVEMLSMFQKVSLCASSLNAAHSKKPPFAEAFRVSINALLLLYRQLKAENHWFPIVGLSLDCLDDFFYKIRKKYSLTVPTTEQVLNCMTTFPICTIFTYSCGKQQSSNELKIFMTKIQNLENMKKYDIRAPLRDPCTDEMSELCNVRLSAQHGVEHLAVCLLRHAERRHRYCPRMQRYWSSAGADQQSHQNIGVTEDGVIVNPVPRNFYEFINKLETIFKDYFQKKGVTPSISRLQLLIKYIIFEMPCDCFPANYVKLLYLRFRLHLTLKYNNQLFESSAPDQCKRVLVVNDL